MKDPIERQAAIDAADEIIARDESGNNDVVKALRAWKAYIKALPSAQPEIIPQFTVTGGEPQEFVPVVRCRDCKHKNVYRFPPKYDERDYCEKQGKVVDVADFCSWAERREE